MILRPNSCRTTCHDVPDPLQSPVRDTTPRLPTKAIMDTSRLQRCGQLDHCTFAYGESGLALSFPHLNH